MIFRYTIYFVVFCVTIISGARLKDVSYSIKQNGVMINIDYDVDPKNLLKNVDIPIQGGLHPEVLLTNKMHLRKEVNKYLEIFKDHPYVFNLGHGILPETKIEMVEIFVELF